MVNSLIESHLGYAYAMVADVAGKYPPNVSRCDLNGAAELGLVQAAHSYDPARGVSFATFAYFRIRGAIFDEIRKLWQSSGLSDRTPESSESQEDGTGETLLGDASSEMESSDVCVTSRRTRVGKIVDPESLPDVRESVANRMVREQECERIRKALDQLPKRHRFVLQAYYYDGVSMVDIGEQLNVSKSWVSRIHAQALTMVRGNMEGSHSTCRKRSRTTRHRSGLPSPRGRNLHAEHAITP